MALRDEEVNDTYMQIGLIVLIGITGLISYGQGVHNGKVELCQSQNLQYAITTAGDACISQDQIDFNTQLWDRTPQLNNTEQWQIT